MSDFEAVKENSPKKKIETRENATQSKRYQQQRN